MSAPDLRTVAPAPTVTARHSRTAWPTGSATPPQFNPPIAWMEPTLATAAPVALLRARLRTAAERFALIFAQPLRVWRRRIDAWIAARTPRQQAPVSVLRHRIYILPTRYGYLFAGLLLVMLLGAMNYSNSMAFALTFLLAGLGLIGMHHTNSNLLNLRALSLRASAVHAGETAQFELELENPGRRPRYRIEASWGDVPTLSNVDLDAGGRDRLRLPLHTVRRGRLPAPRLMLRSEFPLGLFYAWTYLELSSDCLVYPRPAPAQSAAPPAAEGASGQHPDARAGQDEFAGLRSYQRGDSLGRIYWKSFARLGSLESKQFGDTLDATLWLDWAQLPPSLDTERRLSLLTRWILDAETSGRRYGLKIPGQTLPPGHGGPHREACLKALALFPPVGQTA